MLQAVRLSQLQVVQEQAWVELPQGSNALKAEWITLVCSNMVQVQA